MTTEALKAVLTERIAELHRLTREGADQLHLARLRGMVRAYRDVLKLLTSET